MRRTQVIEVKCPVCSSESIDCYDIESENNIQYNLCYCEECSAHFEVKYVATEIKLIEE